MTKSAINLGSPKHADSAMLENLSSRFRPGGLYLLLLRADGTVAYHDAAAGLFFHRFVLPLIQFSDAEDHWLRTRICKITTDSALTHWDDLAGVSIAAFPFVERKQLAGVFLLAGKDGSFKLSEEIVHKCSALGLDSQWLLQQADELPSYSSAALLTQARLLQTMVRDQTRLAGMDQELNSLSGQLANTYEELSLIYQLSSGMRINRRAADFFKQACLDVMDVMSVRGMGVAVNAAEFDGVEPVLYGHLSLPPGQVHRLASELIALLSQRKSVLLINDLSRDKNFGWMSAHANQLLAVPLQRQEQVLGCFFALDKQISEFDSQDSKLLTSIANESAIYLENAMLFEDVHGLMMGLLHSLTSAVDAKDAYTCGHSERVALLSKQLAIEAGLGEPLAERIYMAGLLHDVGKIGVPESVLQKTGKLTAEEFEYMKKHPAIGARILADVKQVRDIIPGVLHHHERYDGKGYPHGLAGENIPIFGRVICLADCFDAMTSNRTYRKALPLETAIEEIRRCSGTQFDPALADAFLRIGVDRFREVLRSHLEKVQSLEQTAQNAGKPEQCAGRHRKTFRKRRPSAMPVKSEVYSNVCVLEVHGDFVGENITAAHKLVESHIDERHVVDFVVDLAKSGFIDSEGLEALLAIKRRSDELFGQVKLIRLDENCRKILEITRLEHRFECHDDLARAIKTMR